jgi:hypothetical protein
MFSGEAPVAPAQLSRPVLAFHSLYIECPCAFCSVIPIPGRPSAVLVPCERIFFVSPGCSGIVPSPGIVESEA